MSSLIPLILLYSSHWSIVPRLACHFPTSGWFFFYSQSYPFVAYSVTLARKRYKRQMAAAHRRFSRGFALFHVVCDWCVGFHCFRSNVWHVFLFSYLLYLWIGTKRKAEEYLCKLKGKMERENSMNTFPKFKCPCDFHASRRYARMSTSIRGLVTKCINAIPCCYRNATIRADKNLM